MSRLILLSLFVATLLLLTALPSHCAAQTMVVLEQKHRIYGRATVYLAADAVKVVSRDRDIEFLACAPKWDVLLYKPDRKVIHHFFFKQWSVNGIKTALNGLEDNDKYLTMEATVEPTERYAGVTAQVLSFNNKPRARAKIGDYFTATTLPVSADACRVLCAIWDTRANCGVPLRFRVMKTINFTASNYGSQNDYKLVNSLETHKIEFVPYNAKLFIAPAGYREVQDGEIFIGHQDMKDLQEVLGN